jgi:shikimate kinase
VLSSQDKGPEFKAVLPKKEREELMKQKRDHYKKINHLEIQVKERKFILRSFSNSFSYTLVSLQTV